MWVETTLIIGTVHDIVSFFYGRVICKYGREGRFF